LPTMKGKARWDRPAISASNGQSMPKHLPSSTCTSSTLSQLQQPDVDMVASHRMMMPVHAFTNPLGLQCGVGVQTFGRAELLRQGQASILLTSSKSQACQPRGDYGTQIRD
jgi:hypothetical protein